MKIVLDTPDAVLDMAGVAEHGQIKIETVKHHVYTTHKLVPDGRAGDLHPCFKLSTVDAFLAKLNKYKQGRRYPGRPRKTEG